MLVGPVRGPEIHGGYVRDHWGLISRWHERHLIIKVDGL